MEWDGATIGWAASSSLYEEHSLSGSSSSSLIGCLYSSTYSAIVYRLDRKCKYVLYGTIHLTQRHSTIMHNHILILLFKLRGHAYLCRHAIYTITILLYISVSIICTSAKMNENGCRDAPCEKSWKQGNPLSNTIKDTSTIMRNPLPKLCREGYA